jgi:hypothetical protein
MICDGDFQISDELASETERDDTFSAKPFPQADFSFLDPT